jgi:hypothetical protein
MITKIYRSFSRMTAQPAGYRLEAYSTMLSGVSRDVLEMIGPASLRTQRTDPTGYRRIGCQPVSGLEFSSDHCSRSVHWH